jgi:hypothetical protein
MNSFASLSPPGISISRKARSSGEMTDCAGIVRAAMIVSAVPAHGSKRQMIRNLII